MLKGFSNIMLKTKIQIVTKFVGMRPNVVIGRGDIPIEFEIILTPFFRRIGRKCGSEC